MPVDEEKSRRLTEMFGNKAPAHEWDNDDSIHQLASKFTQCQVDPEDGCTYCQRADNGEWEQVYCP